MLHPIALICISLEARVLWQRTSASINVAIRNRKFRTFQTTLAKNKTKPAISGAELESESDIFGIGHLEEAISKVEARLRNELSSLRQGRANPEVLDKIKVKLPGSKQEVGLKEVAHVAVRDGRTIQITVYEPEMNPVQNTSNSNLLNIPLPPPSRESRQLTANLVSKVGESFKLEIRKIRADGLKKVRDRNISGIGADAKRLSEKKIEKLMENAGKSFAKSIEEAKEAVMDG
ncbi:Ribosome-recycling factor, mitochondrial [Neolecta irregularis DAH-3]|uniref:Ribosome-recycling factor, mitochondrial n=1 Tax=Neolecta irregularis (strain DAH-3) TaxID=1198029 RepID=A0A1U7LJ80_NEOID|nr:Ribosome-recycling factor, mitochondrial [Neolecta irregularis DAH-3]|eukprot:OLL22707.1 Ribosome-recycling factor, mitochondrial [Neolecta irregularis DAH-3]